jgi:tetratricopeptide (TPR) repeat protein
MHSLLARNVFVLVTMLLLVPSVHSQEPDAATQLRLAQLSEQAGEWERAVTLYEGLYRSDTKNFVYFEGLRRGYTQLRQFDKAINLVERQLKMQSMDVGLLASLGGLYYEAGTAEKADSIWNRIIVIDPKNSGLYRMVASQMMEHRLFEEAANLYRTGRRTIGNESAFADELANLYYILQQYASATTEFIGMLKASPQQLIFIQSRIASYTIRSEGLRAATEVTKEEVRQNPQNVALLKLYAWLAMEGKDYQTALDEYRIIDRIGNSGGAELFNFARRAAQETQYRVAARAFRDIIEGTHTPAILSQARFGYARTMEDLNAESDSMLSSRTLTGQPSDSSLSTRISEIERSFQGVLGLYEAVIKDYPSTDLSAQSEYRIGIIRMNRFYDFDGALDVFNRVKRTSRTPELSCDASLRMAEVYTRKNDLQSARSEYERLVQIPLPAYQQQAQFCIAELDYFLGQFDSSIARLKQLSANLGSDMSNDVLLLQYFILENKSASPAALLDFAKADLQMRQRKYSEALGRFGDIVQSYPLSLLVDDATMKMGELQLLLNRTNEAIASFHHLVNDMPESILRDRAQMKIAKTYESVYKDRSKAIEAYEELLVKFPNSLFVEEARKRIRQLRGDSI